MIFVGLILLWLVGIMTGMALQQIIDLKGNAKRSGDR